MIRTNAEMLEELCRTMKLVDVRLRDPVSSAEGEV